MSKLRWLIYVQPLYRIVFIILILVAAWSIMGRIAGKRRWWHILNLVVCIGIVATIVYMTVYNRAGNIREAVLMPFHSFIEAQEQPEIYRSMLMNVFLFVPIGLSLPFALPIEHNGTITILFAFCLSIFIEFIQYKYGLGRCEVDDVIMNTLGALIGTLAYDLSAKNNKEKLWKSKERSRLK